MRWIDCSRRARVRSRAALARSPRRPSRPDAKIVVWHAYRGEEKAAFEKVVAAYNAANAAKGVKVTTLAVPYDAFADKITAAVPRGKGPDIFIYAQDRLGGWIEAGNTIEPIDFFLDKAIDGPLHPDHDGGDDLPRARSTACRSTTRSSPSSTTRSWSRRRRRPRRSWSRSAKKLTDAATGPLRPRLLLLRLLLPRGAA